MLKETRDQAETFTMWTAVKLLAAVCFCVSAYALYDQQGTEEQQHDEHPSTRRLQEISGAPSYMKPLFQDLDDRKKLFDDTPPEEVKYWFEYSGPLQVSERVSIVFCFTNRKR